MVHTSLRRTLTIAIVILAALAMLSSGSLLVVTEHLKTEGKRVRNAMRGARRAEELHVGLLSYDRNPNLSARQILRRRIEETLTEARQYVDDEEEREVLNRAEKEIRDYFHSKQTMPDSKLIAAGPNAADIDSAISTLDTLVRINVRQADAAMGEAAEWEQAANLVGLGVAVTLVVGVASVLIWLRFYAFRPIFHMISAIRRFAGGDRSARAPVIGPLEFREIAGSFNEMAVALDERHRRQLTFLSGVAHDLRNPLSALALSTAGVSPERPLPSEERIRKAFDLVRRQTDRLNRMIGDFLDASRIEAGNLELKPRECDLRNLARNTMELFESSSPLHELRLSVPSEPIRAPCDPERIEQVLNNLVSNAIKYSPQGGPVEVSVTREQSQAIISVRDQGCGMSVQDQQRIFRPFSRTGTSRETIPGVGLGLFVARTIVRAHGGDIEVESAPGAGSVFRVRLPAASNRLT
jgi:signal transduction histidine kinase